MDIELESSKSLVYRECFIVPAQDKLLQKEHFLEAGVPVADFLSVEDAAAAQRAAEAFGFPFMLKARRYTQPATPQRTLSFSF
jgi:phosphoribosylaminoimidazole carboxylase (NCAIR synthetase)